MNNNYNRQNPNQPPRLQKYGTDTMDRKPMRGKYNNFMDDSQNMMGPGPSPIPHQPSFENQPYTGNFDQRAYPAAGYDIDKSSRSGRSGNGGMPQLKSRPRQAFNNSPDDEA